MIEVKVNRVPTSSSNNASHTHTHTWKNGANVCVWCVDCTVQRVWGNSIRHYVHINKFQQYMFILDNWMNKKKETTIDEKRTGPEKSW